MHPGYYNNEGKPAERSERDGPYGAGRLPSLRCWKRGARRLSQRPCARYLRAQASRGFWINAHTSPCRDRSRSQASMHRRRRCRRRAHKPPWPVMCLELDLLRKHTGPVRRGQDQTLRVQDQGACTVGLVRIEADARQDSCCLGAQSKKKIPKAPIGAPFASPPSRTAAHRPPRTCWREQARSRHRHTHSRHRSASPSRCETSVLCATDWRPDREICRAAHGPRSCRSRRRPTDRNRLVYADKMTPRRLPA